MRSFESFLESLGLRPRDIVPGKWMRCPTETHPRKKNGSYKLAEDGLIGWAMDFAAHAEPAVWRPESGEAPTVDRAAIERRRSQERRDIAQATRGAQEFYLRCHPVRDEHEYLTRKGLTMEGCSGLKIDPRTGALVVPMYVGRTISSVQSITSGGAKRFWPGARTKGATYIIERPGAPVTILCEGLATGLTLFAAVPTSRVVVAFSTGNFPAAAAAIPSGMRCVAADNDHETEARIGVNPGVVAAHRAAKEMGCGVAIPEGSGTDWNDYFCEQLEALRESEQGKRRPRAESELVRDVNARINAAVMKQTRWQGA